MVMDGHRRNKARAHAEDAVATEAGSRIPAWVQIQEVCGHED